MPQQVSLFLQNESQEPDGSIVVPIGGILPYNTFPPGIVSYPQQDYRQEHVAIISAGLYGHSESRIGRVNLSGAPLTNLGTNMFNQNKSGGGKGGGGPGGGNVPQQVERYFLFVKKMIAWRILNPPRIRVIPYCRNMSST